MADWFAAMREFKLRGDDEQLASWWNGHAARPYRRTLSKVDEGDLAKYVLPELPPETVPGEAQALTLAVDHQAGFLPFSVWAHRVRMEPGGVRSVDHWAISYGKLGGFGDLEAMVREGVWRREGKDGERLGLWRRALDTGGTRIGEQDDASMTMRAYNFIRAHPRGFVWGTKGMSRKPVTGVPVEPKAHGKLPNGKRLSVPLTLYFVDTDTFKRSLMWILDAGEEKAEGADTLRFHAAAGDEYFRQLLGEQLRPDPKKKGQEIWVKTRTNDWLDCAVLHLAMTSAYWYPALGPGGGGGVRVKRKNPGGNPALQGV